MKWFLVILLLAIGERQIYDESIPGLRYDDGPNERNKGRQFLDDENDYEYMMQPDYPSEELSDPPEVCEEFPTA